MRVIDEMGMVEKYSPDQPRDEHGQWTNELLSRVSQPDGGFSVQPVTRYEPTHGYMVSPYPERSVRLTTKTATPAELVRFLVKNADLLSKGDHYFGGWQDPSSSTIWLDVAVHTGSARSAEALARKHGQLAYFDLEAGKSVRIEKEASDGTTHVARREPEASDAGARDRALGKPDGTEGHGSGDRGGAEGVRETPRKEHRVGGGIFHPGHFHHPALDHFENIAKYSPDEPRDEIGRWTEGGGSAAARWKESIASKPNAAAQQHAQEYMRTAGMEYKPKARVPFNEAKAARIANAYAAMPHNPQDPAVKKAYTALGKETLAQFQVLKNAGIKVHAVPEGAPDPYADAGSVAEDVEKNHHMWYYPTTNGFGSDKQFDAADNLLLHPSEEKDADGRPMLMNDVFRVVHDYFGHVKDGNSFRPSGEEAAYRSHAAMFSKAALPALAAETRGQNSWVYYGPNGEKNRKAIKSEDVTFADQKTGLLPDWATKGLSLVSDEQAEDIKDDLLVAPNFPNVPNPKLKPRLPTRTYTEAVEQGVLYFAKAANHDGVMVAIRIPPIAARQIAVPNGEKPEDLHVTLAYLGDAADLDAEGLNKLTAALHRACAHIAPFTGRITGYGRFRTESDEDDEMAQDVMWAGFDAADLPELRHQVVQAVHDAGLELAGDHGFTPHITLAYVEPGEGDDHMPPDQDVTIKRLTLVVAGREQAINLEGKPSSTDDKKPQWPIAYSWSQIQQPKQDPFTRMEDLEQWAQNKGDLIVRADIGSPPCVIIKKGLDVQIAVEDHPFNQPQRLDDLVNAMQRIAHDYVIYGWICAKSLSGKYLTAPAEIERVMDALGEPATPIFLPCDIMVLDGDVTKKSARERFELLRSLVPVAGSHILFPVQIECPVDSQLEVIVDEALKWRPSDDPDGLVPIGVTVVRADSVYTEGETDDEAQLSLKGKAKFAKIGWTDEAREAAAAARRQHATVTAITPPKLRDKAWRINDGQYSALLTVQPSGIGDEDETEKVLYVMDVEREEDTPEDPRAMLRTLRAIQDVARKEGLPAIEAQIVNEKLGQVVSHLPGVIYRPAYIRDEDSHRGLYKIPVPTTKSADWDDETILKDLGGMGGGVGPGPGEDPNWREDPERWKKPNFPGATETKDAFGTGDLAGGMLAPQQGMFRHKKPRMLRIAIDRDAGDMVSVSVPLSMIPTTPRRGRAEDRDSNRGTNLRFFGKDEGGAQGAGGGNQDGDSFSVGYGVVGGHTFVVGRLKDGEWVVDPEFKRVNPYEAIFQRKGVRLEKYSPDQPRNDQGEWTMGDEPADFNFRTSLRNISGEGLVSPQGQGYSGQTHVQMAGAIGEGSVSDLVDSGWIRAVIDSTSVGLEMDIKNPDAVRNAVALLRANHKAEFVVIDPPVNQRHTVNRAAQFQKVGDAIRWLQDKPDFNKVEKGGPEPDKPIDGNPDGKKPRKYPDVGEDMGFNDSYLTKEQYEFLYVFRVGWTDEAREAAAEARRRNAEGKTNVYMRPEDLKQVDGRWQHPEHGILTAPIAPDDVPPTLYHVTTNMPAVQASGMLKGMSDGGGLGGGNNMAGVSFTASKDDADHIERALHREVEMAHLPVNDRGAVESALTGYARDDEKRAGLPHGSLDPAVEFAMSNYDGNTESRTHGWNDATLRYDAILNPEELASRDRSSRHEAHAQYNQLRESKAGDAVMGESNRSYAEWKQHPAYQWTKNPLLLSSGEQAYRVNAEHVGTVAIPRENIPDGALVRPGSDDFLHEIRVHADVPLHKISKYNENHAPAGSGHGGEFTSGPGGEGGGPTPAPKKPSGQLRLPGTEASTWEPSNPADKERQAYLEERRVESVAEMSHEFEAIKGTEVEIPSAGWDGLSDDEKSEIQSQWEQDNYDEHYNAAVEEAEKEWRNDAENEIESDFDNDEDWHKEAMKKAIQDAAAAKGIDDDKIDEFVDKYTPDEVRGERTEVSAAMKELFNGSDVALGQVVQNYDSAYNEEKQRRIDDLEVPDSVSENAHETAQEAVSEAFGELDSDTLDELAGDSGGSTKGEVEEPKEWLVEKPGGQQHPTLSLREQETNYRQTQLAAHALLVKRVETIWQKEHPGKELPDDLAKDVIAHGSDFWNAWKGSSSNTRTYDMQAALVSELGANQMGQRVGTPDETDKIYAKALWDTTQFVLDKAHKPEVTLYRAVFRPIDEVMGPDVPGYTHYDSETGLPTSNLEIPEDRHFRLASHLTLKQHPAQSFTFSPSVANHWGGVGISHMDRPKRVVIRAKVPATAVWSLPVYGKNEQEENEAVVLGTPWKKWEAWVDKAPNDYGTLAIKTAHEAPGNRFDKNGIDLNEGPHWLSGHRKSKLPRQRKSLLSRRILAPDPDVAEPTIEEKAGVDGKVRLGAAFERAAKYVLAHPEAVLVHGTRTIGEQTMKHAWVELPGGEVVYDGEQGKFFVSYDYKSKMRAETHVRYRRDDTVTLLRKCQHFGPWIITEAL